MILWLFVACGSEATTPAPEVAVPVAAAEARPQPVQTEKASAPVDLVRTDTKEGSAVQFTFLTPGKNLTLRVWGAGGLELVPAEQDLREVNAGQIVTLSVQHVGAGDLAVSIAGTWQGVSGDDVRSFTIGDRSRTVVPTRTVGGKRLKGWNATPK